MDWNVIGFCAAPIFVLIGYLHMRLTKAEEELETMMTKDDVKDMLSEKLEVVRLQQELLRERLSRVEESLDRISDKIDRLISRP